MDTSIIGSAAEHLVRSKLTELGYNIYISDLMNNPTTDILVESKKSILKVQIRTLTDRKDRPNQFTLGVSKPGYDIIIGADLKTENLFILSNEEVGVATTCKSITKNSEYKNCFNTLGEPLETTSLNIGSSTENYVIYKLLRLGFGVSKPTDNRLPYDLIIEKNNKFTTIQIKNAYIIKSKYSDSYFGKTRRSYNIGGKCATRPIDFNVDFFIYHILDKKISYIIPKDVVKKYSSGLSFSTSLTLRPHASVQTETHKFKEAWDLISSNAPK